MAVRVRKDVWKMPKWDPVLEWYSRAILAMQSRPIADTTSWRYQAAIHEYIRGADPLADPADQLPPKSHTDRFWDQCQHGSWFFLPWHRMYLAYFERIVADTIRSLGGPDDWSLPYWNYGDTSNPDARRLPPAFRDKTMEDGSPNGLYVSERDPICNRGDLVVTEREAQLDWCLRETQFTAAATGGTAGFGGPQTGFMHWQRISGVLEVVPHGTVHGKVGGDTGWMSAFNTAALDPIFWLHHANIDRAWVVWRRSSPQKVDPTLAQWLSGVTFDLHDSQGNVVQHRARDVVDTQAPLLNYRYEEESVPPSSIGPSPAASPTMTMTLATPEMLGATEEPVLLTNAPATTRIAIVPASAPQPGMSMSEPKLYLNVENVTGRVRGRTYAVYINVPAGEDPEKFPELLVGLMPTFGLTESSRSDARHSASGLQFAFDIDAAVGALKARKAWDPKTLQVSFVPHGVPRAPESLPPTASVSAPEPIQIGRVSLYTS